MAHGFDAPNIIDLGETFDPEVGDSRTKRAQWTKTARVVVPTALSLFLISGAASAAPPPISPLTDIPVTVGAVMTTFGDRVVVVDGQSAKKQVTVVDMAAGTRWTSPLAVATPDAVNLVSDTVIVSVGEMEPGAVRAEAFDLRTGRHLWSRPDGLVDVDAAGHVIVESPMPDGSGVMAGIDVRTGADDWHLVAPSECVDYFPGSAAIFLVARAMTLVARPTSAAKTLAPQPP